MKDAPAAAEAARVEAVRDERILDTPPGQVFDDLASLAAAALRVPVVLINFVDADRQWFKAKVGVMQSEAPRFAGFCPQVVASGRTVMIPDAAAHPE